MGTRYEVEITITSAKDLKNVNWRHGKLKPYAVVWVDPKSKCSTRVDDEGDASPFWDEKLTIPFNSPVDESTLYIDIVHANAADGTKPLIGSAKLPLRDVVDDVGLGIRSEMKLELKRPSGRPQGKVEINVIVRDLGFHAPPEPYYAPPYGVPPPGTRDYPAPPYGSGYVAQPAYVAPPYGSQPAYAAPPYASPYGAPPAYAAPPSGYLAYGAPPSYSQQSYGQGGYYGQGQQQGYVEGEKKKNKFGGMGTGLAVGAVAGALGGLALAEGFDALEDKIADDVADKVEADYGDDDGDDY
ncbi:PREDICTED: uncharacterized protein LOC105971701 [Erythranthe guttata]|uniref:uncharacterized protein LOC105971701 n=1 Tax=Erythranthe guttata TaxID=4155 RepID=UPI00064DE1A2|nr:PREDICTED: uncharacterized protein LOC105971701 [Erythranthe guttata]|eukprot:XP_012852025.1 PREDICTED: uncharacterized protein LOC105971701 [Erythranthe guttata]